MVINSETIQVHFFSEKKFKRSRTPEELLSEIETVISETEVLQQKFSEVTLIFTNEIYAVIPASLFEESKISEYLKFNSKILPSDFIAHDIIDNYDMVVIYVPYVNINNYFFDCFGSFQYYHGASLFLKNVLASEKHSIIPKIYLHIQREQFDCIVVKNGDLQLCNSYSIKTPEDLVYYVLFCLEQLNLNPDTIALLLCGDIEENDANYKLLFTYVRNISFTTAPQSTNLEIDSEASHKNYLLKST